MGLHAASRCIGTPLFPQRTVHGDELPFISLKFRGNHDPAQPAGGITVTTRFGLLVYLLPLKYPKLQKTQVNASVLITPGAFSPRKCPILPEHAFTIMVGTQTWGDCTAAQRAKAHLPRPVQVCSPVKHITYTHLILSYASLTSELNDHFMVDSTVGRFGHWACLNGHARSRHYYDREYVGGWDADLPRQTIADKAIWLLNSWIKVYACWR